MVRKNTLAGEQTFTEHHSALFRLMLTRSLVFYLGFYHSSFAVSIVIPVVPSLLRDWGMGKTMPLPVLDADWFPLCHNATFIFCGKYHEECNESVVYKGPI